MAAIGEASRLNSCCFIPGANPDDELSFLKPNLSSWNSGGISASTFTRLQGSSPASVHSSVWRDECILPLFTLTKILLLE